MKEPTPIRLAELLAYDTETGALRWLIARGNKASGSPAGSLGEHGYIDVGIDGGLYRAHRVIWALVTGEWPPIDIDHWDTVKSNNRWLNLRLASDAVNMQNVRCARVNNACGLLGVSRKKHRRSKPWQAQIRVAGKQRHIGYFDRPQEAHAAYLAEKRKHHPGCTL